MFYHGRCMLSAEKIIGLHDQLTRERHETGTPRNDLTLDEVAEPGWMAAVARQHRANFELWHIEDEARAPGATPTRLPA